jgi:hypothetical protein
MIIVPLLSPEPVGWYQHPQLYSGVGADIVIESISPTTTARGRIFTLEHKERRDHIRNRVRATGSVD